MNIEQLNHEFEIQNQLCFTMGQSGMPIVEIQNKSACASIALQGAHLLSFQPQGEQPLIWLSDDAVFAAGKSVRGGVPVCWPWFGAHATDAALPAHGYARTMFWQPVATSRLADGITSIRLTLMHDETTAKLCDAPLVANLHITVGKTLTMALETTNLGQKPFVLSEALHSYFLVGDIRQLSVEGLENVVYLDKVEGFVAKQQHGAIDFAEEVDRVYLKGGSCCICDPILERKILIRSHGSDATVVWNPWAEVAENIGDMGEDGYLKMLCVETANAASQVVTLAAGATHQMSVEYHIEPYGI